MNEFSEDSDTDLEVRERILTGELERGSITWADQSRLFAIRREIDRRTSAKGEKQ